MDKRLERMFAVAAPGLEEVCAGELIALGMAGVRVVPGGAEFAGDLRDLYRANLWLRTASRVLVRVGELKARDFPELFRKGVRLPWGRYVRPGTRVRVRASSQCSRLGHTGRIAATVGDAIDRALGRPLPPGEGPEQLVLARFEDDVCLLSVDSSGELLHRRGYREEGALAPLRETLAAGILMLLGWDGSVPLVDPMCGSGTFLIEGALIARGRPPAVGRPFAFMHWPRYRPGLWTALQLEAAGREKVSGSPIAGSDREPRAVAAARRNAVRAGVLDDVEVRELEFTALESHRGPGLVLCNPPYGERLGREDDLPSLFRTLGRTFRERFAGWQCAILCPDERLAQATGLPLAKAAVLSNGGIPVALYTAALP